MKNKLLTISFLFFMGTLNGQTYIQEGSTLKTSKVKFIYDANIGGNRPLLSINYLDGFDLFETVMPVCEGDYSWCLKNGDYENIAYLKIDFNSTKSKIVVKIKYDSSIEKEPTKEKFKQHIKMLEGTFVR
jgi:hypothetical protein